MTKTQSSADRKRVAPSGLAVPSDSHDVVDVVAAPPILPPALVQQRDPSLFGGLHTGLNRAEVHRLFGNPDLRTTFLNRGALLEKYIYVQKSEGRAVVATLRNGEVENVWSGNSAMAVDIR